MIRNNIINAPSKFDLMVALFDKPNTKNDDRRSVDFTIQGPICYNEERQIEIIVNCISKGDKYKESFYFKGYCKTDFDHSKHWMAEVTGWFQTFNRKGWIDIDVLIQGNERMNNPKTQCKR
jgi:hypothetical protein